MSRQEILAEAAQVLAELREEDAAEVLDFATFLRQRRQAREHEAAAADDALLLRQIEHHVSTSETFAFLHDEAEDVYTDANVKFRYDAPPADATE